MKIKNSKIIKPRNRKYRIYAQRKRILSALFSNINLVPLYALKDNWDNLIVELDQPGHTCTISLIELAKKSIFFRKLLEYHQGQNVITVPDCVAKSFRSQIEFIKYGKTKITDSNVHDLYFGSDYLGVERLRQNCLHYFRTMTQLPEAALGAWVSLQNLYCPELETSVYNSIMENFEEIRKSELFLKLQFSQIFQILEDDKLCVIDESHVHLAALRWLAHNPIQSSSEIEDLLLLCRLGFLKRPVKQLEWLMEQDITKNLSKINSIIKNLKNNMIENDPENINSVFKMFRPRKSYQTIMVFGGYYENHGAKAAVQIYNPNCDTWSIWPNSYPLSNSNLGAQAQTINQGQLLLGEIPPRVYAGCVIVEKRVYLVGGMDGNVPQRSTLCFDFETEVGWVEISSMIERRYYVSVTATQTGRGFLYAIGGHTGVSNIMGLCGCRLKSCERLSLSDHVWRLICDMNLVRSDADACCLNDKVYVVGGFDGVRYHDSAEVYSPDVDQWTLIGRMHTPRSGVSLAVLKGYIYVFGGNSGNIRVSSIERYNPDSDKWQVIGSMNIRRSNLCSAVCQNSIYLIGGWSDEQPESGILDMVERFDSETATCEILQPLKFPVSASCTGTLTGFGIVSRYLPPVDYRQTILQVLKRTLSASNLDVDFEITDTVLELVDKFLIEFDNNDVKFSIKDSNYIINSIVKDIPNSIDNSLNSVSCHQDTNTHIGQNEIISGNHCEEFSGDNHDSDPSTPSKDIYSINAINSAIKPQNKLSMSLKLATNDDSSNNNSNNSNAS